MFLFLGKKFAPNSFKGLMTLEKSRFERLLSPISFILYGDLIKRANINLPKVPELPALIIKPFLNLKLLSPMPFISQKFFLIFISVPSFLRHSSVLNTSSDFNKL